MQLNLIDNGTISNGSLPLKASFTEGEIRVTDSATIIKNVVLGKNTSIAGGRLAGKIQENKDNFLIIYPDGEQQILMQF